MIRLDIDNDEPSPMEQADRLLRVARSAGPAPDKYGEGDVVQQAEALIARVLGKERAVIFPTGTLANMVALDRHCPRFARRVLLHPESHVLADTGDSAAGVMGLTLVAVTPDGPGFTAAAARRAIRESRVGRVRQGIGAVVIETPLRRHANAVFPVAAMDEVLAVAREEQVATHLDGARLPIAAQSAGRSLAQFCAPFDSVYFSLWKMLALPFGAALAGSAASLDGVEHDRRRYGGALPQLWPIAALTLAHLEERLAQWPEIFARAASLRGRLAKDPRYVVSDVGSEPSNAFWLEIRGADPYRLRETARREDLHLPEPQGQRFPIRANASWCRSADAISIIADALGRAVEAS
jgi:threonine aldolase